MTERQFLDLDATTLRETLDGVRGVVHIGPAFHPLETAMGQLVVDAALAAGVQRSVQFSVYHPQLNFLVNHQAQLRLEVRRELRIGLHNPAADDYMQNFDPLQIAGDGVFRLPYSLSIPLSLC